MIEVIKKTFSGTKYAKKRQVCLFVTWKKTGEEKCVRAAEAIIQMRLWM